MARAGETGIAAIVRKSFASEGGAWVENAEIVRFARDDQSARGEDGEAASLGEPGRTQHFARLGTIALDEIVGAGAFFPFELNFDKFERTALGTSDQQAGAVDTKRGWGQRFIERTRFHDLQRLTPELGVSAGPRLEPAKAVVNLACRAREIDEAIFFLEDGSEGGEGGAPTRFRSPVLALAPGWST